MDVIGLFYGSSTCYTEIAAEKIAAQITQLNSAVQVELHDIASESIHRACDYQYLILGIPTWDFGELQEDWDNIWDALDEVDWTGKSVALYGLGDQIGYPKWFQDALGYLWAKVDSLGAKTMGRTCAKGYCFSASKALSSDQSCFLGLALDEDSEFELSDQRIAGWCEQILLEFVDDGAF